MEEEGKEDEFEGQAWEEEGTMEPTTVGGKECVLGRTDAATARLGGTVAKPELPKLEEEDDDWRSEGKPD
jgi:hypothetical protein